MSQQHNNTEILFRMTKKSSPHCKRSKQEYTDKVFNCNSKCQECIKRAIIQKLMSSYSSFKTIRGRKVSHLKFCNDTAKKRITAVV